MKFNDFLTEARPTGIDSIVKGVVVSRALKDLYDKYKTETFSGNSAREVLDYLDNYASFTRIKNILISIGYMETVTRSTMKITDEGEAYVTGKSADQGGLAKGVKDISRLKEKKFIVPKVGNNSKYVEQMKSLLAHMDSFARGRSTTTYMLAGDPGTGKTSFIKSLATLTGIPLVVIEAPHITQEHLINIPFLLLNGDKKETGNVTAETGGGDFKVVQAESSLVTKIKSLPKKTDDQIQKLINKNKALKDIQPLCQRRLDLIKGKYKAILFVDEYYRTSSVKIRNVLRNILNGKLGDDKIPKGTYVVMASNFNDDGIGEIPKNNDFMRMNYDISSKDDFMSYMYGNYVNNPDDESTAENTDNAIDMNVWNAFMENLIDKDLGFNDEAADVRLSPRRLEQIILYVNAALPIKTPEEGVNLLAFIKTNFSNYLNEEQSRLHSKFEDIVINLIKETSPDVSIEQVTEMPIRKSEWRSQLQQQIEMKMQLGDKRKYVPVVSGEPGIGKTTQMVDMAKDMGMGFIQIDTSNLTVDATTGLPIANTRGDGDITTSFSNPPLHLTIMKEYNALIDDVKVEGRKYNVIILFDELNRAEVPVFNAIRKVLLEKEFEGTDENGEAVKIPDDVIVTGAINPHDEGTVEFTTHTRDVLDIIPSSGNFSNTVEYIKSKKEFLADDEYIGFGITDSETNLLQSLALQFKSHVYPGDGGEDKVIEDSEVQPFWWDSGDTVFYVSPREMTETVGHTIGQTSENLLDMLFDAENEYEEEDYEKFIDECINSAGKAYTESFDNITGKQEVEGFVELLAMKIVNGAEYRKFFENIRSNTDTNAMRLSQILKNASGDINYLSSKKVIGDYLATPFSANEFSQDVAELIESWRSQQPEQLVENVIKLHKALTRSLSKLESTNQHISFLNTSVGRTIADLMLSNKLNLADVLEDDKLIELMGEL